MIPYWRLGGVVLALTVAVAVARADGRQDQQAFRASAEAVTVDASVQRGGRPVKGLALEDFQLLDNGVPQVVRDLSYERLPIDVTVALDISGSVTGPLLDRLRRGVQELRADLGAADRLEVLTFNHRIRRIARFGQSAAELDAAFTTIRPGGSSAIVDSLAAALTTPVGADRRHLIVLFSDGYDTSSINDLGVLLDVARRSSSTVHAVLPRAGSQPLGRDPFAGLNLPTMGPNGPAFSTGVAQMFEAAREVYQFLAEETGGVVFGIAPGENLGSTFRRALNEFRSSYVLHFVPAGVERTGVHTLEVRVSKYSGIEVRARREYVWR